MEVGTKKDGTMYNEYADGKIDPTGFGKVFFYCLLYVRGAESAGVQGQYSISHLLLIYRLSLQIMGTVKMVKKSKHLA